MTRSPDPRVSVPPLADGRPPYSRRHTSADPSNVVTENQVPNERKALPSQKRLAMILAFAGAGVALAAVILDFYEIDALAVVLAILAVLMTGASLVMALNDARTGSVAPALCLIVAGAVLAVALMDVLDVPEAIGNTQQNLRENADERIVGEDEQPPVVAE